MPLQVESMENQRGRFVVEALEPGMNKAQLCREFGISRPTGYAWLRKYKRGGFAALRDESKRPHKFPTATTPQIVMEIVSIRTRKPSWGGRKIRARLLRSGFKDVPHARSIDRILKRCGLVQSKSRSRKAKLPQPDVVQALRANHVWTIDFKGWWLTQDGVRCEPLTVRDEYSKFIIGIFALKVTTFKAVKECLIQCFERYGLPEYIRCDNGHPFISMNSIHGLTRLSAWWIKLGITPNRIPPASPGMNGAHERMHRDMKKELQKNPARNLREEQERFDQWRYEFNNERSHEALADKVPADVYLRSSRRYNATDRDYPYPAAFVTRRVDSKGEISWHGTTVRISKSFAGEQIGIEHLKEKAVRVWFAHFCLGVSDIHLKAPLFQARLSTRDSSEAKAA